MDIMFGGKVVCVCGYGEVSMPCRRGFIIYGCGHRLVKAAALL